MEFVSPNPEIEPSAAKLRRPSQIALALDRESRVLFVNRDLAGTGFSRIQDDSRGTLHELLHPDCDGQCRFNSLLKRAWKSLEGERASVEWEIEDPVWRGCLRLNLFRPLTSRHVEVDRRRRFALMTVTDITDIRREFQSVLANNKALQQRVTELESAATGAAPAAANEEHTGYVSTLPPPSLGAQIIAAQERERHRIASELHDSVAQSLGVIKYGVESKIAALKRENPGLDLAEFDPVVEQIRETLVELRKVTHDLSPAVINEFGICTAIDMLCRDVSDQIDDIQIDCLSCVQETSLPEAVHVAIYRVAQEAINNTRKHANASRIEVRLSSHQGQVTLRIVDDGDGFDTSAAHGKDNVGKGLGLDSMRERVEMTGGQFELQSQPGRGTTVLASWPESALQLL